MNRETQQDQNEEAMNYKKILYALIEDINDPRAAYMKEYRRRNKDRLNAYARQWRKDNPEKVASYTEKQWEKRARTNNSQ